MRPSVASQTLGAAVDGTLDIQTAPGVVVILLRGEHDLSTQPRLRATIDEALAAGMSVVIDLSEAEFIDSTVVAAILHGHRRATDGDGGRGQGLAVVASPGARFVARMLSLVDIEDHVAVHLSQDSAVVSLELVGPAVGAST
jgi:anti-sigma B factor antagonist